MTSDNGKQILSSLTQPAYDGLADGNLSRIGNAAIGQLADEYAARVAAGRRALALMKRMRSQPLHAPTAPVTRLDHSGAEQTDPSAKRPIKVRVKYYRTIPVTVAEQNDKWYTTSNLRASARTLWLRLKAAFSHLNDRLAQTNHTGLILVAAFIALAGIWVYLQLPRLIDASAPPQTANLNLTSGAPIVYNVPAPTGQPTVATGESTPDQSTAGYRSADYPSGTPSIQTEGADPSVSSGDTSATVDPSSQPPAETSPTPGGQGQGSEEPTPSPSEPTNPIGDLLNSIIGLL